MRQHPKELHGQLWEQRIYAKAGLIAEKQRKREESGERSIFHGRPILRGLVAASGAGGSDRWSCLDVRRFRALGGAADQTQWHTAKLRCSSLA